MHGAECGSRWMPASKASIPSGDLMADRLMKGLVGHVVCTV